MKKNLLLTLAVGAVGTSQLMAVDLYITGSTAFRKQVYQACTKMYDHGVPAFTAVGTAATGGDANTGSAAAQWVMSGTVSNSVTALGTTPLVIHGLFTGSVQGLQTVQAKTPLLFLNAAGTAAVTNTPTIAFSDVDSSSTPYPYPANYNEEDVAVQPFVFTKSLAGGGLNNITNISSEQLKYAIQAGKIPLSSWTHQAADHGSFVYLINRTKDSGTRRTSFAEVGDLYNQSAVIYLYDSVTNNAFYRPSGTAIVGAAGNNNANLGWGSGYVGGGDVVNEQKVANVANQAVAYLSVSDAKSITGVNWQQVIAYNGVWPTAAGAGISNNSGTNDFSPISLGQYPFWAYEVVDYPNVDPSSLSSDQNLTAAQLGTGTTAGTIMGVLNAQTLNNGGSPITGSIEEEIKISEALGGTGFPATALTLTEMFASRQSVGGTVTP